VGLEQGEFLGIAFGTVLAVIPVAVMQFSPRRWWLHFWFPAGANPVRPDLYYTLVIDPLFNKFEPLNQQHPDLVASIEKT